MRVPRTVTHSRRSVRATMTRPPVRAAAAPRAPTAARATIRRVAPIAVSRPASASGVIRTRSGYSPAKYSAVQPYPSSMPMYLAR